MHWLETKIPPPIVLLLLGMAAFGVARAFPGFSYALPWRTIIAVALVCAGLLLNLVPKLAFGRAGTTVNPLRPALTTSLVTTGIYRCTRNPMYLGQATILLGWTVHLHNLAALAAVPAFMLYVTRFQIVPEERHLATRFPDAYAAYRRQVSRWLSIRPSVD